MQQNFKSLLGVLMGLMVYDASAHLVAGSLLPAGGETFKAGARVPIHWMIEQEHSGSYQISYSTAPATWVVIYDGLRNSGARFNQPMDTAWIVPSNMSTNSMVRLRVWQKATGEPGNTAAGDTTTFYVLVSRNFTVTGATTQITANPAAVRWGSSSSRVLMAQLDGRMLYREPSAKLHPRMVFQIERP